VHFAQFATFFGLKNLKLSKFSSQIANLLSLCVRFICENITDFSQYPSEAIFISAKEKKGLGGLILKIRSYFETNYTKLNLVIPYSQLSVFHSLQNYIENSSLEYCNECLKAEIIVINKFRNRFDIFK
jgi:50S ribosomal subunit-associated GTPase HflX